MDSNKVYPPPPDAAYPPPAFSGGQPPPPAYQAPGYQPPPPAYGQHPPPGYQPPPPAYGQPTTGQPGSTTVVVVAHNRDNPDPCPHCGGRRIHHVTPLGWLFMVLCFPCGIIICCALMEYKCDNCGK